MPRIISRCDDNEQFAEFSFIKGFFNSLTPKKLYSVLTVPRHMEIFCADKARVSEDEKLKVKMQKRLDYIEILRREMDNLESDVLVHQRRGIRTDIYKHLKDIKHKKPVKKKLGTPLNDGTRQVDSRKEFRPSKQKSFDTNRVNFDDVDEATRKAKTTKLKLRAIIEEYYRSKGQQRENGGLEMMAKKSLRAQQSMEAIMKKEHIKQIIEEIFSMDLFQLCNLDKISRKACLKIISQSKNYITLTSQVFILTRSKILAHTNTIAYVKCLCQIRRTMAFSTWQ
uniref:Uncharacterized protein n=1 Tax=Glossina morsitans morsitans TaxID=37546 RepID=A0A1B0GAV8_GLOMM